MKKLLAAALFALLAVPAFAQTGYQIKVTLKPYKNAWVYLGHYSGKNLPIIDSARLSDRSEAIFKGAKKLPAGVYLIGFPDRSRNFELLIDKTQNFAVSTDSSLQKITFTNSKENTDFQAYQQAMTGYGKKLEALQARKSSGKDTAGIAAQMIAVNNAAKSHQSTIIKNGGNSLLSALLKAAQDPEVPRAVQQSKDSMASYKWYKQHYWDGVAFYDDRLVRTPFFEARLDKYFEQLVYPAADSVIKEIDWMLGYAAAAPEMQKFLLIKFANRYLNQKYMWEDKVFVHLFEKYFSGKEYDWLNAQGRKTITDRAYSLMANIFGNPASDIELPDTAGKKTTLYGVNAPYTLLVIFDPTCGHCKEVVPRLDSFYVAKWKAQGLQPFAVAKETDGNKEDWKKFIAEHKLSKGWVHVYNSKVEDNARIGAGLPGYGQLFDVQSFPTLYLLDKDKRIIAKKIDVAGIDEILALKQKEKN